MRATILLFCIWWSFGSFAEVAVYESTKDVGLNKLERIDSMEKYMTGLSSELKALEKKVEENSQKIKSVETAMNDFKSEVNKKMQLPPPDNAKLFDEIKKLKSSMYDIQDLLKEITKKVPAPTK